MFLARAIDLRPCLTDASRFTRRFCNEKINTYTNFRDKLVSKTKRTATNRSGLFGVSNDLFLLRLTVRKLFLRLYFGFALCKNFRECGKQSM